MRRHPSVPLALGALAALAGAPLSAQPAADAARVGVRPPAGPAAPPAAAAPPTAGPRAAVSDRWMGADKVRHFAIAGLVQGTAFAAATALGVRGGPALATASVVTGVLSVGKELHDRRRGGRASVRDLAWDAAGAALWGVLVARSGR